MDDLPRFTMIYHDLPRFTMTYHDLPWLTTMIYHDLPIYQDLRLLFWSPEFYTGWNRIWRSLLQCSCCQSSWGPNLAFSTFSRLLLQKRSHYFTQPLFLSSYSCYSSRSAWSISSDITTEPSGKVDSTVCYYWNTIYGTMQPLEFPTNTSSNTSRTSVPANAT